MSSRKQKEINSMIAFIKIIVNTWLQLLIPCTPDNSYDGKKWTLWSEFKSWMKLFAFYFKIMPLGKVGLGSVLWHINHCWLFNPKSSLSLSIYIYIYIYIWFGLVGFYGISTIVSYFLLNSLYIYIYIYIYQTYDLIWLGFMAYQPL